MRHLNEIDKVVNHPSHYTFSKFEVIEVLQEWFPSDPLLWQIVKYVARAKHKGLYLQDLKKAEFYLKRAIAEAEREMLNVSTDNINQTTSL